MKVRSVLSRCLLLSVLVLGFVLHGCGSTTKPAPTAPIRVAAQSSTQPARSDTPGLFLYEVTTPKGPSYLLGTIHVGFGFEEVLTDGARRRFGAAQRVMMEADVTAVDPTRLMQSALLAPGESLHRLLGDETWQKLVARLGAQIPPMVMDRLKPWMPAVTLGLDDIENALHELKPNAEGRMMDLELMTKAREAKKELLYFETIEEQIAVFDAIPVQEQVSELERTLSSEPTGQGRAMLEAFAQGNEAALCDALFDAEQLESAPGFYEAVLFQRNARWLPKIERELLRGGVFIAVGAAHLLGERGILSELRNKGYKVERVGG